MKYLGIGLLAIVVVAGLFFIYKSSQKSVTQQGKEASTLSDATSSASIMEENIPSNFDKNKHYTATLKTTAGDITIELNAAMTPKTVANFVTLAKKNFYNNTIFHRVIKGFMIQGGDPTGTGSGGPGYTFPDEPFEGEYSRGTVAMANAGPNTNGSQFFIMHANVPLPKNYVIFGHVVSGIETVDKIATAAVTMSDSGENSQPVNPVKILSVEISEK